MLTQQKPQSQVSAPKIWNQPTAKAQIGDYIRVPFAPVMQVVDRDVLENGQVWLLLKPTTASHTEEWVLEPDAEQPPAPQPKPQRQPSGFSGDSVASQMRSPKEQCQRLEPEVAPQQKAPAPPPTPDVEAESEQGRMHGKHDAAARLHPIYTKATDAYSAGYLSGYVRYRSSQQSQGQQPVEWSLTWNQQWGWYDVWVNHRWIGRAATEQEAERMATKRIALNSMIERQNRAVMAAYAFGA